MPTTSLHQRILEATQTRVQALTLAGLDDANVVVVKDARNYQGLTLPAIVIAPVRREQINVGEGDNETDQIDYFVLVAIIAADDGSLTSTTNLDAKLVWRENLIKGLQHYPYPTITEVWDTHILPLDVMERQALRSNIFDSALVLRVRSNVARTAA